ncbi:MAG: type II toxin-antitoxin system RelE/ParE family toxin [Thermodesulfovibrionales bacterium]
MSNWTIKVYIAASGINYFQKWLDSLPKTAQVDIDERIRLLAATGFWHRPYAAKLKGYDEIWEIRILSGNVQYRPLGVFDLGEKVFSLLIGAIEKGSRFEPKNAPKIAEKRRSLFLENKGHLDEYC